MVHQVPDGAVLVFAGAILIAVLVGLAITILSVFAFCRIFSKAGFSWAFGLLILIPIANVIVPLILAFSDWPVLKELQALKGQRGYSEPMPARS
jgi:hypothetical protein